MRTISCANKLVLSVRIYFC